MLRRSPKLSHGQPCASCRSKPMTSWICSRCIAFASAWGAVHKGREFAGWIGLVPREHSTGGQQKLLGISKRGNSYLRRLFVQGARAVLQQRTKQSSGLSAWLAQLTSRTHRNVVAVALANKLARIAWAVLAKNEPYRHPILADAAAA